jgi:protein-tyrosine phosphatase
VLTAAAGLKVSYSDSITHKVLPVYDCDTENIGRYFEDSYSFICEGLERGNVYVHCFAGVSRSATIVVSFLMKKFQWGLTQALTYTKKKRRYIEPNPGFMRQLRRY